MSFWNNAPILQKMGVVASQIVEAVSSCFLGRVDKRQDDFEDRLATCELITRSFAQGGGLCCGGPALWSKG